MESTLSKKEDVESLLKPRSPPVASTTQAAIAEEKLKTESSTSNFDKFGKDLLNVMYNYPHPKNWGETEKAVDDNACVQNAENKMKTQSSSNKMMPPRADFSSSKEYDEKYKEIVEQPEGFVSFPCSTSTKMGSIWPCPVNALVKKAANFAIEEHNKKTGANIKLLMVVKANMQFQDDGLVFYLTLQTLDGDHIVFKEAKVCEYIDIDPRYELNIFRNAIYYDKIKASAPSMTVPPKELNHWAKLESNYGGNADSFTEGSPQRYQKCRSEDIFTRKLAFFDAHKDEEWLKNKYHPSNLLRAIERRKRHAQEIAKEFLFYLSRGIVNLSPSAAAFYTSKVNFQTSQPNCYEKAGEKRRRLDKDQDEESEFSAALKAHPVSCLPRRIRSDIEQAFALVQKLDSEKGIEDNIICNINFYGEFHSESMFQVLVVKCLRGERVLYGIELLDTLLTYLWRIHGVNYYGMIESDEPKGFRHVRSDGKNHTETLEDGVVWEKKLDTFWQKRLSGRHAMEAMIGKEKIDTADVEAVRKIADESGGWKYGCEANGCTEVFHSVECVREHLKLEHPELLIELTSKVRQDLYFHNYMSDPDAPGGTL